MINKISIGLYFFLTKKDVGTYRIKKSKSKVKSSILSALSAIYTCCTIIWVHVAYIEFKKENTVPF